MTTSIQPARFYVNYTSIAADINCTTVCASKVGAKDPARLIRVLEDGDLHVLMRDPDTGKDVDCTFPVLAGDEITGQFLIIYDTGTTLDAITLGF